MARTFTVPTFQHLDERTGEETQHTGLICMCCVNFGRLFGLRNDVINVLVSLDLRLVIHDGALPRVLLVVVSMSGYLGKNGNAASSVTACCLSYSHTAMTLVVPSPR